MACWEKGKHLMRKKLSYLEECACVIERRYSLAASGNRKFVSVSLLEAGKGFADRDGEFLVS